MKKKFFIAFIYGPRHRIEYIHIHVCVYVCVVEFVCETIMPVICDSNEMVCESNLSGAIREALATSSSHQSGNTSLISGTDELNIQDRLIACAKRLLINKIEYEEAPSSSTTLYENLKSKYVVLKPGISTQKPQQNGVCIAERIPIVNGHSGTQGKTCKIFAEKNDM